MTYEPKYHVYGCPMNGGPKVLPKGERMHFVMELVKDGRPIPHCPYHNVRMTLVEA